MDIDESMYTVLGQGHCPLIAFHGFSQDYRAFEALSEVAPSLRIYCFKLFAHGFPIPTTLPPTALQDAWLHAMQKWIERQPWDKFGLLAFSMGSRPALQLLRHCPSKISRATLLAPEGLSVHPIYWLSTRTQLGRHLFRAATNPKLLTAVVRQLGGMLGWKPGVKALWLREIAQQPNRLFQAWQQYKGWEVKPRHLIPHLPPKLPIDIWLAKNDLYVGTRNPSRLAKRHPYAQIIQPSCTHFYLLHHYSKAYPTLSPSQQFCQSKPAS